MYTHDQRIHIIDEARRWHDLSISRLRRHNTSAANGG